MFDNKFLGRFMNWRIYLSGEIHTNWRDELKLAANEAGLNVEFLGPETDHDLSDNSGANILGSEDRKFRYCSSKIWRKIQTMERSF